MATFRQLITLLLCVAVHSREECAINDVTSCDDCSAPGVEESDGPRMAPLMKEDIYGVPQLMDNQFTVEMQRNLEDMKIYFQGLRSDPTTSLEMHELLDNCKNKHEACNFWKVLGECEKVRNFPSIMTELQEL